ncbi:MAG: 2-oxo acid dehydrogenase subunit E2 [Planctomycetota bacterium]
MKTYRIGRSHKFFDVTAGIVGREIRMGDTVTFLSEIDLSEVESIRQAVPKGGNKPSYTAFVAKAVALALREFPYANRRLFRLFGLPFLRRRFQQFTRCDITVAVERDVPGVEVATFIDILRDVDQRSLAGLTRQLHALATSDETTNRQWRQFKTISTCLPVWLAKWIVRMPVHIPSLWAKYRGGSVLISSPAKYGVDAVVGAWMAPIGISFGLVKDRAVVRRGAVVARRTFVLTLNFDRRMMAGAQAAKFYRRIADILEHARTEMGEMDSGKNTPVPAAANRIAALAARDKE